MTTLQHPAPTFDDVWRMFQESDRRFQETERLMKESSAETDRRFQESDRKHQETERLMVSLLQTCLNFVVTAFGGSSR